MNSEQLAVSKQDAAAVRQVILGWMSFFDLISRLSEYGQSPESEWVQILKGLYSEAGDALQIVDYLRPSGEESTGDESFRLCLLQPENPSLPEFWSFVRGAIRVRKEPADQES